MLSDNHKIRAVQNELDSYVYIYMYMYRYGSSINANIHASDAVRLKVVNTTASMLTMVISRSTMRTAFHIYVLKRL